MHAADTTEKFILIFKLKLDLHIEKLVSILRTLDTPITDTLSFKKL